jgi:hypothetical protein
MVVIKITTVVVKEEEKKTTTIHCAKKSATYKSAFKTLHSQYNPAP